MQRLKGPAIRSLRLTDNCFALGNERSGLTIDSRNKRILDCGLINRNDHFYIQMQFRFSIKEFK